MKKKIGLVGYFGWGNFGDELFIEAHKQNLSDDFELHVLHDILEEPYFSRPIDEYVEPCDAILIGGGDLINPVRHSPLYWREEYLKKPVFVYGIGVPSAKHRRSEAIEHYRRFFQHPNCKLIVARDIESARWIVENLAPACPVRWFADAVCSLDLPEPTPQTQKTLGVVMRSHRSLAADLSAVRTMVDRAKEMDYKIRHLVLANLVLGKADHDLISSMAQPDEEVVYSESLNEMCQAISSCSMLASIKFHGVIAAAMYGVPSVAMSVTPKNRNFLRMIERPEMLCSYTDPELYKRIPWNPTRIPKAVQSEVRESSLAGYRWLKCALQATFAGEPVPIPEAEPVVSAVGVQPILASGQKVVSKSAPQKSKKLADRVGALVGELPRRLGVEPSALKGARVLEIGCARGDMTFATMQIFDADAYGVDIGEKWIGGAYESLADKKRLAVMDSDGLPTARMGKFDFIQSYSYTESLQDPTVLFRRVSSLLKRGGRAYFALKLKCGTQGSGLGAFLPDMPLIHLTHTEDEAKAIMLERHGFERGFIEINDWRPDDYLRAFDGAGLNVIKHWFSNQKPEIDYYTRNREKLGAYPIADLAKAVFHVTVERPKLLGKYGAIKVD